MYSDEEIKAAARVAFEAQHGEVWTWEEIGANARQKWIDSQRAALNAVQRWRPIESAPKDGTPVLTKVEDKTGSYEPAVSRWFSLDNLRGNETIGYLPEWRDGVWLTAEPDDFESDQALAKYICGSDYKPTHFMWLPR
jgi:hypothetical protein